ncbi:MAG: hypothetical protein ACTILJ_08255 [Pseudolactococcus laudensis]|uniref:hypothetical protein n=1 Tax=Pseudolactococcus laudensis TaxID=1494461 RepID=UPI003F987C0D
MRKKNKKGIVALTILVLIFVAYGIRINSNTDASSNQSKTEKLSSADIQAKADEKAAKTYEPTQEIKAITEKIGFTKKGRVLFYASDPQLLDAENFNEEVPDSTDSRTILGYYDHRQIYLYNIQNQDLSGIVEVTSAHETLHAVWDRLSSSERQELTKLLEAEYAKVKTDKSEEMLADYAKFEIGQRDNELHSYLGTEYRHLSPELEKHYAKYFEDRDKIVTMFESYESKFDALDKQSEHLSAELTALKAQIDTDMPQYDTDLANLNAEIEAFNVRAESYYYTSEADFYADRNALEQRAAELEARQTQININIDHYNTKAAELNQIALKASEFNKSINSKATDPSQPAKKAE